MRIRFHVKKWMDREDFMKILEIADYLGREKGFSEFELNMLKIKKNKYGLEDVLSLLRDVGVNLSSTEIRYLEKNIGERREVILKWSGTETVMKPRFFLGDYLSDIKKYVRYDSNTRTFTIIPCYFFELKKKLLDLGFNVNDKTSLKERTALPIKPEFTAELRDYQEEALRAWMENDMRGIIALPTGSGKTIIALAALAMISERTLIVTYTKEQMFQWKDMLQKFTNIPSEFIGLYYGEEKNLASITVTTYQTSYRHVKKLAPFFSFIIIDECHHLPADKFKHIAINMFAYHRMGLSATPEREDGRHEELFPLMGGIVYYRPPSDLSNRGYLAPYIIRQIYVELDEEEKRKYRRLIEKYRSLSRGLRFHELLSNAKKGDFKAVEALRVHSNIRQLVSKARGKITAVKKVVESEISRGGKIIVFTQYVDQAEEIGKVLGAPVLTGETPTNIRNNILRGFKQGRSKILVVTTVGDEGIDIPDVNVGIIVAGTGSRRQFVQRLGRLLRPRPGKRAVLYEVIVKGTSEEAQARRRKRLTLHDFS